MVTFCKKNARTRCAQGSRSDRPSKAFGKVRAGQRKPRLALRLCRNLLAVGAGFRNLPMHARLATVKQSDGVSEGPRTKRGYKNDDERNKNKRGFENARFSAHVSGVCPVKVPARKLAPPCLAHELAVSPTNDTTIVVEIHICISMEAFFNN